MNKLSPKNSATLDLLRQIGLFFFCHVFSVWSAFSFPSNTSLVPVSSSSCQNNTRPVSHTLSGTFTVWLWACLSWATSASALELFLAPSFTIPWWWSMMVVTCHWRGTEAWKPSFKFSTVDCLARKRKQLNLLLLAMCRAKVSFPPIFLEGSTPAVKPYFKLDECKVISSERIAMGTERQLSPPSERGS